MEETMNELIRHKYIRYDNGGGYLHPSEHGQWVRFEDADNLRQRIAELEEQLGKQTCLARSLINAFIR
jgi:hypothetical protein